MSDSRAYLESHKVQEAIAAAVSQVLKDRPANPVAAISDILAKAGKEDQYSGFAKFDAKAKAEVFGKVFDVGKPMWEKLGAMVAPSMPASPTKILSVGDGPGEPGCYLAEKFGCATISSDSVPPMVALAKKRAETKGLGKVECLVLDMDDLSSIESASVDLLSSAHAYPFVPDQPKAIAEAMRVLKPGGVFGAVVWVSFELLPLAGALMGAVTGSAPPPPKPDAPPPPPLAWKDTAVSDKLLKEAGFELTDSSDDVVNFELPDLDVAMKYSALPIWDKIAALESGGTVPDAWAKYEAAWPTIAKEKGHLGDFAGFKIKGVYRTIVAKKPA